MSRVIYNVTVSVNQESHDKWLHWLKNVNVAEVLNTGCFQSARLLRVHALEEGGVTYAIQYEADSMDAYNRYQADFAQGLQAKGESLFSGQVHSFRTVLEVLDTFARQECPL